MKRIDVNSLRAINRFPDFMQYLKQRKGFTFVRIGDGEWGLILKRDPIYSILKKRWDGSLLLEQSIPMLRDIVKTRQSYHLGIQPHAFGLFTEDILSTIPNGTNYCNSDIFHNKSQAGELDEFFKILNERNVILVGKGYLKGLRKRFRFHHVLSPDAYWKKNNFKFMQRMENQIEEKIKDTRNPVILYSAGIAGKIVLNNLYKKHGNSITQIDTGSLFEPYVGLNIRSYHEKVIQKLK